MSRHAVVEEDLEQIARADLPWSALAGARVLVTGASGLIAAYVTEFLLFLNERQTGAPMQILALVRNREKALERFAAYANRPDFELVVQDVCEPLALPGPVQYIIHSASPANVRICSADPAGTLKSNMVGTYQLLELARRSACRGFLFVSSGEVYGQFGPTQTRPLSENCYGVLDPLALRACYGEAKRAGEALCSAWHLQYGAPTRIARLGHTYGPGMDLADERVFADFVGRVVRRENIVLKSDGSAMRPFCYLADAVAGLFTVLLKGAGGEAYNLVNDQAELRIGDLAELLCGLFPEWRLRVVRPPPPENQPQPVLWNPGIRVCSAKLRALGWTPFTTPEAGFRRTVRFYVT